MNVTERLYRYVKRYGSKRTKSEHVNLGHGSWSGNHRWTFYKLRVGRYILNASEEYHDGSSLAGLEKGVTRRLALRTTRQIFSATREVVEKDDTKMASSSWQTKGNVPENLLNQMNLQL